MKKKVYWILGIGLILALSFFWNGQRFDWPFQVQSSKNASQQQKIEGLKILDETKRELEQTNNLRNEEKQEPLPNKSESKEEVEEDQLNEINESEPVPSIPQSTAKKDSSESELESKSETSQKIENEQREQPTEEQEAEEQDLYLTDPVPAGKPKPVEWQNTSVDEDQSYTATLFVTASTILDHMDQFNANKLEVLPDDGIIYETREVTFSEGESVFDVLLREMKANKIHMEFVMTPLYNSYYIEGINNLYEFDCGELSGWMYKVNDWFPNYGASRYKLEDGDRIEWMYTCDLGRDIGGDWNEQSGG